MFTLTSIGAFLGSAVVNTLFIGVIALIVANIVLGALDKLLTKSSKIDPTVAKFIKSCAKFLAYFFVSLFVLNGLGFDTSSVVALASVFSAAIALSAQTFISNLLGGATMLATRPFKVGDYISVAGVEGVVAEVGMFYTVINTVDNKRITVPNGAAAGSTITNFSAEGKRRVDVTVSVGYNNSVDAVKSALLEAINSTNNVLDEEKFTRLSNYDANTITYTIRVWTASANYWGVYFDLLENIKVSFDKNNITFSYPHVVVHKED